MSYTPDPNNAETPADSVAQGRSHAEIRAIKGKINQVQQDYQAADTSLQETIQAESEARTSADTALGEQIGAVNNALTEHKNDTDNPHGVDKHKVGLGNIPNKVFAAFSDFFNPANPSMEVENGLASGDAVGKLAHAILETIQETAVETFQATMRVGHILCSADSTFNPNLIPPYNFATWIRLDDVYLKGRAAAVDAVKDTVGSHAKTLTTANIPSHNHSATVTDPGHAHNYTRTNETAGVNSIGSFTVRRGTTGATTSSQQTGISVAIGNTGNGAPFDIKPKSYVVNIWERVA